MQYNIHQYERLSRIMRVYIYIYNNKPQILQFIAPLTLRKMLLSLITLFIEDFWTHHQMTRCDTN